ncbi:MAG TPA: sulfite exporter TauE/SafE family protein [Rubrivivax sp.]|nr:sulfite exporter TauE/SafE family protein [Rubrivivax sp.]HPO18816.1 sulfite exporter TauE/SafE family protein [Rubrivivax sp.]
MDFAHAAAGLGVGFLVGLTGVGGGALMTPLLVLVFGQAPAVAVGTDLWFAAITKIAGGGLHHGRGNVDWQVLRRLCLGSLPAAVLTLVWLKFAGGPQVKEGLILNALGAMIVLTALAMLLRKQVQALGRSLRLGAAERFKHWQPALTVAAGAILGVLVTLTSVGAGALGAVMLSYLYPLRMTPRRLVATDLVHAVPLTMVAGSGHLWMGHVDGGLLAALLIGSIPGVLLGAHFSDRAPERFVRPAIAVVLVAVGFKLVAA